MTRGGRRWTEEEIRTLTMGVGAFGIGYLMRKLGRSRASIDAKIQELFGGGVSRGTHSLAALAEATGYDRRQLQRAGRALRQRWPRTSSTGRMMLSDDQGEALVLWLAHDYWCRRARVYACVWCGRDDVEAHGLGLCRADYFARRQAFRRVGLPFGKDGLLQVVADVRRRTPKAQRDWLDAFEASLGEGCVLTRGTLDRLLRAASPRGP